MDPPTRHHTKRETTRRKGNAERARLLKCIDLQAKLARVMQLEQRPSDEFIQSINKEPAKKLNNTLQ